MSYLIYLKLKKEYNNTIFLIQSGNFIHVYQDHSLFLHYFFRYKILKYKSYNKSSFPLNRKEYVYQFLQMKKISFLVYEKDRKVLCLAHPNKYLIYLDNIKCSNQQSKLLLKKIINHIENYNQEQLLQMIKQLGIK